MPFYKIAETLDDIEFQENSMCVFAVEGRHISLLRREGRLVAFAAKCPHAGSLLSQGYIDVKGCVVCPLHGYRFDLHNGRNITGEGYRLKIFKTEQRPDGWYVEI